VSPNEEGLCRRASSSLMTAPTTRRTIRRHTCLWSTRPRPPPYRFSRTTASANGLFGNYCPVVSRGGLVLLRRRHASSILDNMCVYDPINGRRTFLSNPPGIRPYQTRCFDRCVLLTAADGIGALLIPAIHALHRHQA
jgi:hypothetical protein